VVLVSGGGSTLQAMLDAGGDPSWGARVVAVGSDREATGGEQRAREAGLDTFVLRLRDAPTRAAWDTMLADRVGAYAPDLVLLAGFMRLTGAAFLERFEGRALNSHPALSPAFPGMHAPADALAYGVRVSGATLFAVDQGIDTGPILAQVPVPVLLDDDVATLHERIKIEERQMLVDTVGRMAREGWSIDDRKVRIGQ
jgi:phosphoribosylglycinamide formyltransferase-1